MTSNLKTDWVEAREDTPDLLPLLPSHYVFAEWRTPVKKAQTSFALGLGTSTPNWTNGKNSVPQNTRSFCLWSPVSTNLQKISTPELGIARLRSRIKRWPTIIRTRLVGGSRWTTEENNRTFAIPKLVLVSFALAAIKHLRSPLSVLSPVSPPIIVQLCNYASTLAAVVSRPPPNLLRACIENPRA